MQLNKIQKIMNKYKNVFEILEKYDKIRELPFQRKRIYITLPIRTLNKLKKLKEKKEMSISRIIEESVEKI